jgi:hypothetical protein
MIKACGFFRFLEFSVERRTLQRAFNVFLFREFHLTSSVMNDQEVPFFIITT